jgi:flagellar hook-associated protein 3 FlgL
VDLTSTRVTERALATTSMRGLQGNLSRLGALQEQLSSGRAITRPSDSPTGTLTAMQVRSDLRQLQQYARNASDGTAWLNTVDSALSGSIGLVQQVRDLTVQGMSTGSGTPAAREALATEVDQLRQSLLGLANTEYLNRPVFGGTTTGHQAFDQNGAYVGDSGSVLRTVANGAKIRVDASADAAFGTGSTQLFTVLAKVSADLRSDPTSLGGDLDNLDTAMSGMQTQLADVGARYNRLTQLGQAATDRMTDLRSVLSEVEDIDIPKTIMELQLQQTAYQVALGATARVVQPSLQDFLH